MYQIKISLFWKNKVSLTLCGFIASRGCRLMVQLPSLYNSTEANLFNDYKLTF